MSISGEPPWNERPENALPVALPALWEINERCLELLRNGARGEGSAAQGFGGPLRARLRRSTKEIRRRAAERKFLLLDMEFQNEEWWRTARTLIPKRFKETSWPECFPQGSAVPLARATLSLAWHSLRTAAWVPTSGVVLGMSRGVAEVMRELQLWEIDRIAEQRYRHLQPRWRDRPGFWGELLVAAESTDLEGMKNVELHGLQLLVGELLAGSRGGGTWRPPQR
jgi:hypothetical protein